MPNRSHSISITKRLLLGAAAFQVVALIIAGSAIDGILTRFVGGQIERQLDSQILALASAATTTEDGPPVLKRDLDLPPYDRALSGWYWQIVGSNGTLTSRSLMNRPIDLSQSPARGPQSELLRVRSRTITLPDQEGVIEITAVAPESDIQQPLGAARWALIWSLIAIASAFSCAMVAQVWLGLRPLKQLTAQLHDVRSGQRSKLPPQQPEEVRELVEEVNALLEQNRDSLDRARAHIANLAHGLKTPLAALSLRLGDKQSTSENAELIELMDRRISHHLRRARAMASETYSEGVELATCVDDLIGVFSTIYRGKKIAIEVSVPLSIIVRCDKQDLDEILGNLLDNAFKWARSLVMVRARVSSNYVEISIDDDGSGLSDSDLAIIGRRGERLDENVVGSGFGLAIAAELSSLYSGALALQRSISGGLSVRLSLPGLSSKTDN